MIDTPPMRLLILWAESVDRLAGGSVHFWGLWEGLQAAGAHVHAVVPCYRHGDIGRRSGITRIHLPGRCLATFLLLQAVILFGLPYWMWRYRPDTLYVRAWFLAFLARPLCRLMHVPLVLEIDGTVDQEAQMRGQSRAVVRLLRLQERLNLRCAEALICVTPGLCAEMVRRGAPKDRVHVLHNGARITTGPCSQAQARAQLKLDMGSYLVGFAGTFAPWQGLHRLIDVAKTVCRRLDRPVRFALMGQGDMEEALRTRIRDENLEDVFLLLPPGDPDRVALFHSACDAVVIPIVEPAKLSWGLSPLKFWDALAMGVPVLVPEESQLGDILRDVDLPGLFSTARANDLADALVAVLRRSAYYQGRRCQVHAYVAGKHSWYARATELLDLLPRPKRRTE